jgi:hypothetical protein
MAGSYRIAVKTARLYCDNFGFCVSVTKTKYVYTDGQEDGVIIGLINYPRFPETAENLLHRAGMLGELLRSALKQQSFTIQMPGDTYFLTTREDDA